VRRLNRLTDKQIRNAKPDKGKFVKRLSDGAGLMLQATASKQGVNKNWIFRYERVGKRHDLGIGPLHTVPLAEARRRAARFRLSILDGIDPLQQRIDARNERKAEMAAQMKTKTFEQCAREYHSIHRKGWKSRRYQAQWI